MTWRERLSPLVKYVLPLLVIFIVVVGSIVAGIATPTESVDFGIGDLQQTQVWFGVLALMMLEISLATPPFGLLLFAAKGVAPSGTTRGEVITSVLPFILMAMAVAALLVFVPSITLVIPNLIAR